MQTIRTFIGYGFLAIGIYVLTVFYLQWKKAAPVATGDGTGFWNKFPALQRIVMAAQGSVTILWGQFTILLACLVGGIGQLGDLFGDPNVKEYAQTLLQPKLVAAAMLIIGVISIISRKRTL